MKDSPFNALRQLKKRSSATKVATKSASGANSVTTDKIETDDSTSADQDLGLFHEMVKGIKPLRQDKVTHNTLSDSSSSVWQARSSKEKNRKIVNQQQRKERQRINASFQFSDGFEAWFDPNQPIKFSRSKTLSGEVKRLRRGEYPPDLTLDLHGYNKEDAKWEIAEFLHSSIKHHHYCICIVHGIGSRILKQQIPNWLVQHPSVLGFHEAPLEWGGKGALLVLMDVMDAGSGEWRKD